MFSSRKVLAFLALGVFLILPGAASADPPPPPTAEQLKKDLEKQQRINEQLSKQIEEQRALVNALADIESLKQRVKELEKLVIVHDDLIKQKLEAMQKEQRRISMSPPQSGTIRLENRLGVPATIIVNDVPYRLQPFQTRDLVSQPAGTFTFEALVEGEGLVQPRTARTLLPNQLYRIFTFIPVTTIPVTTLFP